MASIFQNKFFSKAGQKERIINVGKTLNAAFNPLSKDKVVANTNNKTVNKILETTANHPYITAGVAAAGVTAIKAAPAILSKSALPAGIAGSGSRIATPLLYGGAGLLAGSLFSGSGGSKTGDQTTNPTFTPSQTTNTSQDTIYGDTWIDNSIRQNAGRDIGGLYQSNPFAQSPTMDVQPTQYATQDTDATQEATSSGGINWLLIGAIAVGAYMLTKEA